ncbi:MAG: MFS transporter [Acidobacteriota bacterium]
MDVHGAVASGLNHPGSGFRNPRILITFTWFFLLLAAYYLVRPVRDEMGAAAGVEQLPYLFLATLVAMLVLHPVLAWLVRCYRRRRVVAGLYGLFAWNLAVFYFLLSQGSEETVLWAVRAFWVWLSVFNLFAISLFWSVTVDQLGVAEAKHWFGVLALGGTLGGAVGSGAASLLSPLVAPVTLLPLSGVLLLAAAGFVLLLPARRCEAGPPAAADVPAAGEPLERELNLDQPVGGSVWNGILHTLRSSYLAGIALFMILFTTTTTFLYFQQADLFVREFADRGVRTAMFARVDVAVNLLAAVLQLVATRALLERKGVRFTLLLLPVLSVGGFLLLAWLPAVAALIGFQVLRRAGNLALARPAREVLYTVVSLEDKYKAKNLLDTLVYRLGDQVGAWSWALLTGLGLGFRGVSLAAALLSVGWVCLAAWLGRRQEELATERFRVTANAAVDS